MRLVAIILFVSWFLLGIGSAIYAQSLVIPPNEPINLRPQEKKSTLVYLQLPELSTAEPVTLGENGEKKQAPKKAQIKVFKVLYNPALVDKKKALRAEWKRVFGVDVWYPYYKAKEFEDWVGDKLSVKILKLKGRPTFSGNQVTYSFDSKF